MTNVFLFKKLHTSLLFTSFQKNIHEGLFKRDLVKLCYSKDCK